MPNIRCLRRREQSIQGPDIDRVLVLTTRVHSNNQSFVLVCDESDATSLSAFPVSPETSVGDDFPESECDLAHSILDGVTPLSRTRKLRRPTPTESSPFWHQMGEESSKI